MIQMYCEKKYEMNMDNLVLLVNLVFPVGSSLQTIDVARNGCQNKNEPKKFLTIEKQYHQWTDFVGQNVTKFTIRCHSLIIAQLFLSR